MNSCESKISAACHPCHKSKVIHPCFLKHKHIGLRSNIPLETHPGTFQPSCHFLQRPPGPNRSKLHVAAKCPKPCPVAPCLSSRLFLCFLNECLARLARASMDWSWGLKGSPSPWARKWHSPPFPAWQQLYPGLNICASQKMLGSQKWNFARFVIWRIINKFYQ